MRQVVSVARGRRRRTFAVFAIGGLAGVVGFFGFLRHQATAVLYRKSGVGNSIPPPFTVFGWGFLLDFADMEDSVLGCFSRVKNPEMQKADQEDKLLFGSVCPGRPFSSAYC